MTPPRRPTLPSTQRATPRAKPRDHGTWVWAVVALGTFIWASGCLRRKSNSPVPVAPAPVGDAAITAPGAVAPQRPRNWTVDPAAPQGTAAPPGAATVPPPAVRGEPLHGLPEPLGNPKGPGPEPRWRARARNY